MTPDDPFGEWLPARDGLVHHYMPGESIPVCGKRTRQTGEPCPRRILCASRPLETQRQVRRDCSACRVAHGEFWLNLYPTPVSNSEESARV